MSNEVAVFLDLDNLVIGAKQADMTFDINLVLDAIRNETGGRIVLRQAYGAGRQSKALQQQLAEAGFEVQSATRINSFSKNLADMQIVVNAMGTLVDGREFGTYVLMSGDRDFTPLVQSLRKRGKQVIGIGVRHTTSKSLAELCDAYFYYEDLASKDTVATEVVEGLLAQACDDLLQEQTRVRASILKQRLTELGDGHLEKEGLPEGSFSQLLRRYPHLVQLEQDGSTLYVTRPGQAAGNVPLAQQYRTALKKQRLRVVPPAARFAILSAAIHHLRRERDWAWGQLLSELSTALQDQDEADISKTLINAMLLVAREAGVIRTLKGRSLPTAPVLLQINGEHAFQEAVICCDSTYLQAILNLPLPFDLSAAAVALYDDPAYVPYLQRVSKS